MLISSETQTVRLPEDTTALCRECNYPLRGLSENRCPECGHPFDPSDPWTMNTGRPMPKFAWRLVLPVGPLIRATWYLAFAMV